MIQVMLKGVKTSPLGGEILQSGVGRSLEHGSTVVGVLLVFGLVLDLVDLCPVVCGFLAGVVVVGS